MAGPVVAPANRLMITLSIMLASIMTALDSTIANVALPHMAGSMSASADQITWVLTSYIIAQAIMTPMTGWLAGRLGRKRVYVLSISSFTAVSALCGAAQNLDQIVLFRALQGLTGAAMMPLAQAVMLEIYPPEERGPAMAIWGMGVMLGPIIGPVLGGWLTDNFSWRWVFYVNLPVGAISLLGVLTFIRDDRATSSPPFDAIGFGLLSITLAAFQLFLDRGQSKDWFGSTEVTIEAAVAAVALTLFVIHILSAEHPFLPVRLLKDRNFMASTAIGFAISVVLFSALALLPTMMETLYGYPVVATGLVTSSRGLGTLMSMFVAGRLIGRMDPRAMILIGAVMSAGALFGMSHFNLQMNAHLFIFTGLFQGLGMGLVFTPLSILMFSTLPTALRADAAGFFGLLRSLGQSTGISMMETMLVSTTQVVHSRLVEGLRPDNPLAQAPYLSAPFSLTNQAGVAALDGEVTRQASMVAYIDVFHLMFLVTLGFSLIALLMRPASGPTDKSAVIE